MICGNKCTQSVYTIVYKDTDVETQVYTSCKHNCGVYTICVKGCVERDEHIVCTQLCTIMYTTLYTIVYTNVYSISCAGLYKECVQGCVERDEHTVCTPTNVSSTNERHVHTVCTQLCARTRMLKNKCAKIVNTIVLDDYTNCVQGCVHAPMLHT